MTAVAQESPSQAAAQAVGEHVVRHADWTWSFTHDGTIPLVQARA